MVICTFRLDNQDYAYPISEMIPRMHIANPPFPYNTFHNLEDYAKMQDPMNN